MSFDLICLGEPMVEFNQSATLGGVPAFSQGFGGDTSNCAIAAARLGANAAYLSAVGTDAFGDALVDLWRTEGVDASLVRRDPAASTGIYFVSHGPAGHSFTYYRAGSAASRMTPADLPLDAIRGARILHASGISQAISDSACDATFAAIAAAREAGVTVSYDTNLRLRLWPLARARAVIEETARMADILLPGLDDARQLTGLEKPDAIADHYLGFGCKAVALTMGADGVLIATPERRLTLARHTVTAIDATGAGDAFDGAYLSRVLAGDDPFAAAVFANAAAALSTTGYGAVAPLPREDAVRALLAAQA